MATGGLQGWSADPFGVHEERYFSVGHPTKLVRDRDIESYDDPPSDTELVAAVSSAALRTVDRADAGWDAPDRGPAPFLGGTAAVPAASRNWRGSTVTSAMVLAVCGAFGLAALIGKSGPAPASPVGSLSPAAFVVASAQRTLAQQTAEFTLSGTVQIAGKTVTTAGTGAFDITTSSTEFNYDISMSGHTTVLNELMTGGIAYTRVIVDGHSVAITGGRHWYRMPVAVSGAGATQSDPFTELSILAQLGGSVEPLGTKTIDGVSCQGYAVTPSKQAMLAGARQEAARGNFSTAQTSAELQQVQSSPAFTATVWFDSHQLLRQLSIVEQAQVAGLSGTGSFGMQLVMNLTRYGVPVHIVAPPRSDTVYI